MEYKNFKHLICINFIGKSYFGNDESQNYLIFQPVLTLFQIFSGIVDKNLGWKSKWLSEESITTPTMPSNSFTQNITCNHNSDITVKFEGNCLKQNRAFFTHGNEVDLFIVYVTWF